MARKSDKIRRRWTMQEIALLIDLTNRGTARREICLALGRTYSSLKNKYFQVNAEDYVASFCPARKEKVIYTMRWHEVDGGGLYAKAQEILRGRHRYDRQLGNFVDGKRVSVQEMLRIAGFKAGE